MKKISVVSLFCLLFSLCSCASIEAIEKDYTVYIEESAQEVHQKICSYQENKEYLRKFRTVDKSGHSHEVVIFDKNYLMLDGVTFAYRFDNAMWYSLALTVPGAGTRVVSGTEKIMGFSGYATCIDNPDTTISFIFAQKLFAQPGYENRSEAVRNVKGVSFSGISHTGGYVDDFGNYKKYEYWDYFDKVFLTSKRDVRTQMFSAVSLKS